MAINFPNTPSENTAYEFGGVRYTFTLVGGAPGYWRIAEPGLAGAATILEIDTGAIGDKYVAPSGLEGSKYMDSWRLSAQGGATTDISKNEIVDFDTNGSPGGLTLLRSGNNIRFNTVAASTSARGSVQLDNTTASTSTTKAATANSVKLAYDQAQAAVRMARSFTANDGYLILSPDALNHYVGTNRFVIMWGKQATGSRANSVTYPLTLEAPAYHISLTSVETISQDDTTYFSVQSTTNTGFSYKIQNYGDQKTHWMAFGWLANL